MSLKLNSTIGIIGGGQLARMLALAAARLSYKVVILEPQKNCPAAQVANFHIQTAYDDAAGLKQLEQMCDVVTYEFENVPVGAARSLAKVISVYPAPIALENAQDRIVEKEFLNSMGIQTARFFQIDSQEDLDEALGSFDYKAVLKTRRMGYDGKGQHLILEQKDAIDAFAALGSNPCVLEGFVPFKEEISVIAARGTDGEFKAYEPGVNVHVNGILTKTEVPANLSDETRIRIDEIARNVLEGMDYVGIIGIEFFLLRDGKVLVNEFAPRVHNSGHWTEAACYVSQFEQHIRAISGLPLGDVTRHSDCTMQNLVGGEINEVGALLSQPQNLIHLYGKEEVREGRKMGHVTYLRDKKSD